MFKSLKMTCVAIVLAHVLALNGLAERTFLSKKHGFSLSVPPHFIEIPPPPDQGSAVMVLAPEGGGFPNINVLAVEDPYDLSRPIPLQTERLIESYRQVGLMEAQAEEAGLRQFPFGDAFVATLLYGGGDHRMKSFVAVIPQNNRHLVLTLVDKETSGQGKEIIEQLLTSFTFLEGYTGSRALHGSSPFILYFLLALAVASMLLVGLRRKR